MYDVLIIGAGPTGLACAIEAQKAGLSYYVIEKGGITDAIRRFPVNMTFFSTPELLTLDGLPFTTTNVRPTRSEALQYYRGVVGYHQLNLLLHTTVRAIQKQNDVFLVDTTRTKLAARRVIVATGYYDATNRLNVEGEDLPHVSHYYDEPYRYALSDVVIIGGRNSSVEAALELWRHGARVTLVHRKEELGKAVKYWVRPDMENRIKNGEIAALFNTVVTRIEPEKIHLRNTQTGVESSLRAMFVFPLIGYRPDESLLRSAGVTIAGNLIPQFHPETFETNVAGLYVAGSVMCGCETWSIFIENGRAHAKPIITHIRATF
ncbi:MAG: YpdA family putative bacillithiol disulfide reductase [Candidatus Kapaibacteriota bacterium]|jgi:thioredoxin reductase (NADPH)